LESKYGLLAFDLDGTVLDSGKGPAPAVLAALEKARLIGCRLAVCTGRPETLIPQSVWNIPFLDYVISVNGAMIRELKSGRVLRMLSLQADVVREVCAAARRSGAGLQASFPSGNLIDLRAWYFIYRHMKRSGVKQTVLGNWRRTGRVFSIRPFIRRAIRTAPEPVIKIVCVYRSMEECRAHGGLFVNPGNVEPVSTMGIDIEITAKNATKGQALSALCRELSIGKDAVFAIGDSENDLSMREYSGCFVAMGNAGPDVKNAADYITDSVDHDGAARAIQQHVLKE
jgi:Cof subfamily protein (haloacid dehalogenase superfamily)